MNLSFGIIVLNGEPFTRYCLDALYPHAHEIIVAEGAAESARAFATPEGRSIDGTAETLADYKANHDPDNKLTIVQPDGFWPSRDAQSQAYADRATGDYLWQVDIDEFYQPGAIESVREMLSADPSITGASVRWINFWGGHNTICDGWFLRAGGGDVNRIMKWGKGFTYGKHWEGPRSFDTDGVDQTTVNWLPAQHLADRDIYCYHYGFVFPKQVLRKSSIYLGGTDPTFVHDTSDSWAERNWLRLEDPFHVHNRYDSPSWLEHFSGNHPPAAQAIFAAISCREMNLDTRPDEDVVSLLNSFNYRAKRSIVRHLTSLYIRMGDSHRRHYLTRATETWLAGGLLALARKSLGTVRKAIARKFNRSPKPVSAPRRDSDHSPS